ncbi:hypothetical protein C5167_022950 [Papaver somniferum]|uniref:Uncharacterized protein n=1 Tax=Papaver somniferum TaxID=3469 RepID=A0A4Y7JN29_PAPSO|nr:hypothetical protein C5167_022950 [Papaver somniferum]
MQNLLDDVKPPKVTRPTGRPRNQRRRDNDEIRGRNSRQYMCGKCYTYGHNRKTCTGATAANVDQAPATFTGPHVRPNPATRPPPPQPAPASATNEASTSTAASVTSVRGTKRKRGGEVSTTTTAHEQASVSVTTITRGGRGSRGERGCRGGRGSRGGRTTTPATTTAATTENQNEATAPVTTSTATTSVVFGRKTSTEVPTSSRGRTLRGRGARGYARGKTMHKRGGQIVGVGIMMPEQPRLVREPTRSAQSQVLNPTGRGVGGVQRGCVGSRRGGVSARRGRAFLRGGVVFSTSGRGNMHRIMDWLGTAEQWANDE